MASFTVEIDCCVKVSVISHTWTKNRERIGNGADSYTALAVR